MAAKAAKCATRCHEGTVPGRIGASKLNRVVDDPVLPSIRVFVGHITWPRRVDHIAIDDRRAVQMVILDSHHLIGGVALNLQFRLLLTKIVRSWVEVGQTVIAVGRRILKSYPQIIGSCHRVLAALQYSLVFGLVGCDVVGIVLLDLLSLSLLGVRSIHAVDVVLSDEIELQGSRGNCPRRPVCNQP
jgi:hypothetical protein